MSADHVLRIDISNAAIRNAINPDTIRKVLDQLALAANEVHRVIVFESTGPAFCAGADLRWLQREIQSVGVGGTVDVSLLGDLFAAIRDCPIPTVARVQGSAFGAGVALVASCDFAIALEPAEFALSELRFAIRPDVVVASIGRRVGWTNLRRWTLAAEAVSASRALSAGLLSEISDDLDGALRALIDRLVRLPPGAVRAWKRSLLRYEAETPIPRCDAFPVTSETLAALSSVGIAPQD
ncbi:MAG: enoyl-CoA hydratase/isomerase family protein [Phycisphaerales bacterium]|nr:enoyl-CoA hydratase/isomerase family protein [Phycisphaerales bacterium]